MLDLRCCAPVVENAIGAAMCTTWRDNVCANTRKWTLRRLHEYFSEPFCPWEISLTSLSRPWKWLWRIGRTCGTCNICTNLLQKGLHFGDVCEPMETTIPICFSVVCRLSRTSVAFKRAYVNAHWVLTAPPPHTRSARGLVSNVSTCARRLAWKIHC